ncbi:FtsX-like permease family protein [Phocaeicola sp.]
MKQLYYAIQTILRGRGSNVTKVISLSLGLTIGILLFSQIAFELSYEKCYPDADRLVLVGSGRENIKTGEKAQWWDRSLYAPMAAALRSDLSEQLECATIFFNFELKKVYKDNVELKDVQYAYTDTCFFRTMGVEVLQGNPQELESSENIFVSESFARKAFLGENPIGKKLSLDKQRELTVRGIYRDIPENSIYKADFLGSVYRHGGYITGAGWFNNDIFFNILRLRPGVTREEINLGIGKAMEKYHPSNNNEEWKAVYDAIPLIDLHMDNSDTRTRLKIYTFLGFAIFFVALMNYILISIATLSRRAKVVGVHKCSGASTGNVFNMFIFETGIIVLLSVLISLFIIFNAKDLIEDLLSVRLSSLFTWNTLWVPALTVLFLFLVAGVLPGRLFSRIPVTQVFRRYTEGKKGWKRSLLFVQFTGISFVMGLLIVTMMQYNHLINKDMGIQTHGLAVANTGLAPEEVEHLVGDLRRQPMVENAAPAARNVIGEYWTRGLINNSGKRIATLNFNFCTPEYVKTMGITLIEGTDILKEGDVLVNEELVRLMEWADGAVGKRLNDFNEVGAIVGVFRNVRNYTYYGPQAPIALVCSKGGATYFYNVRLKEPYEDNLNRLNQYMKEVYPTKSLEFILMDNMMKEVYEGVFRFRNSVMITSCFILLIVIMGLIGYVNDETQRRSKEIAIRKVNGAESSHILRLLTRDILYVSIPSVLIGTTVSFFAGKAWLEQFAETIELNPLLFIGAALGVILIIIACVVIRAWKIANENPVLSIKSE